jgi:DNA-binding transcriptional ArsR family regulator
VPSGTSQTFASSYQETAMTTPLALPALRRYLRHGTLPQLAAFEAVIRLGSATRAAQALCVAQPTISGHLKKLGDALGVRLFVLQGKRLVPTAAALALLDATDEVSAVLARCEQTLGGYREDGSRSHALAPKGSSEREVALSDGRA